MMEDGEEQHDSWGVSFEELDDGYHESRESQIGQCKELHNYGEQEVQIPEKEVIATPAETLAAQQELRQKEIENEQLKSDEELAAALHVALNTEDPNLVINQRQALAGKEAFQIDTSPSLQSIQPIQPIPIQHIQPIQPIPTTPKREERNPPFIVPLQSSDKKTSLKLYKDELFSKKCSSLSRVPYVFSSVASVAKQWETAEVVIENVHGGFAISTVLPYLCRVDLSLSPGKSYPLEEGSSLSKAILRQYEKVVTNCFDTSLWDKSKVSKLYGVGNMHKRSNRIGPSSLVKMISRSFSAAVGDSEHNQINSPQETGLVPESIEGGQLSKSPSFLELSEESKGDNTDTLPVGKRGLLKLISRSFSEGNVSNIPKDNEEKEEEGSEESVDNAEDNDDGGLPNLKHSYGSRAKTKHSTVKLKIHAFRYTFPGEKYSYESSEYYAEVKIEGWNNTLSQHHISSRYDKEKGLLLIYLIGNSAVDCVDLVERHALYTTNSEVGNLFSNIAYHVHKQDFFPKPVVLSVDKLVQPFRQLSNMSSKWFPSSSAASFSSSFPSSSSPAKKAQLATNTVHSSENPAVEQQSPKRVPRKSFKSSKPALSRRASEETSKPKRTKSKDLDPPSIRRSKSVDSTSKIKNNPFASELPPINKSSSSSNSNRKVKATKEQAGSSEAISSGKSSKASNKLRRASSVDSSVL